MNHFSLSQEISRELIEFEQWCEGRETTDFDAFVTERKIDDTVANELRQFLDLEKMVGGLALQQTPTTDTEMNGGPNLEGRVLGQYRFIHRVGAGGMGTVWLAEQLEPVQRQVAIKLIRPGLDLDLLVKRFGAERQAMAMMSHPNIAKVLDAGTFDVDRPFIVMEYVDGIPITDYCNQHCLSLSQRLGLFVQLCQAIQHSHQKGLLHRDIKPTNVLISEIDGVPHVKVIDFGLSKVFDEGVFEDPELTQANIAIGSPLWMSPEQAIGYDRQNDVGVDTRTDIYSLGVVLYQLITNTTPITHEFFSTASPAKLMEAIQEKETPYPSVRLEQQKDSSEWVNQQTTSSYSSWSNMLRDDLDWVTMKALEKDRDRRYTTVAALADDVERFMSNEPVVARPPSVLYRTKKLFRKHRGTAFAVTAVAATLVVASAVSIYLALWARSERDVAQNERLKAEQFLGALINVFENFNISNPGVNQNATIQESLYLMRDSLTELEVTDDYPDEASALWRTLAQSLSGSGFHRDAIDVFEKISVLNENCYGKDDDETIKAKLDLAFEYLEARDPNPAKTEAEECLELASKKVPPNHELSIGASVALNIARSFRGELTMAGKELESLSVKSAEKLGETHPYTIRAIAGLAYIKIENQLYAEGIELYEKAQMLAEGQWGKDNRKTIELELLTWEARSKDFVLKVPLEDMKAYLQSATEKFGAGQPFTVRLCSYYVDILKRKRMFDEALATQLASVDAARQQLGEDNLHLARAQVRLADVYFALRNSKDDALDQAIEQLLIAIPKIERQLGKDSLDYLWAQFVLGDSYFFNHDYEKALQVADNQIAAVTNLGPAAPISQGLTDLRARSLMECGQGEKGIEVFQQILQTEVKLHGEESSQAGMAMFRLGEARQIIGQHQAAIDVMEKACKIFEKTYGMRNPDGHMPLALLCIYMMEQQQFERAEKHSRYVLKKLPPDSVGYASSYLYHQTSLAEALASQDKFDDAKKEVQKVFEKEYKEQEKVPFQYALAQTILAQCMIQTDDFQEAEALLDEASQSLQPDKLPPPFSSYYQWFLNRQLELYEKWKKPSKVAEIEALLKRKSEPEPPQ